jgi:murein DD-endopeptidase MepM/ murein hydrolase activator NlpD
MNKIVLLILACMQIANANDQRNKTNNRVGYSPGCYVSDFQEPSKSKYILPYQAGEAYTVSQGVCGGITHTKDYGTYKLDSRYAYDLEMPIGAKIIASRDGKVINIQDFFSNDSSKMEEINYIFIRHKDRSIAIYLHLSPKGALVDVGDKVKQGDMIGIAGNSGFTGGLAHLHFDVRKETTKCKLGAANLEQINLAKFKHCKTIPVTFQNAEPYGLPLLEGRKYKAQP